MDCKDELELFIYEVEVAKQGILIIDLQNMQFEDNGHLKIVYTNQTLTEKL